MKNTKLPQDMEHIAPNLNANAVPNVIQKKPTNKRWIKWTSIAVCFVLLLSVASLGVYAYAKSNLSTETLEWLEWYNGLSEADQLAVNYVPADLCGNINAEGITSETTVMFNEQTFDKADLSTETLEWLEWYNGLSEADQLAVNYIPADLCGNINTEGLTSETK